SPNKTKQAQGEASFNQIKEQEEENNYEEILAASAVLVQLAVERVERAGLPPHMTLFSLIPDVLLVCLNCLSWTDLATLLVAFEFESNGLQRIRQILIQRMNREFSAGLKTIIKKTKGAIKSFSDDDLNYLFAQLPSKDDYPTLSQTEANKLYS
ncbi:hypothetical protein HDU85_001787, partial [Gaertneriomyces sp. JEL0708]